MRGNNSSFIRIGDAIKSFVIVPDTERTYVSHYVNIDGKNQKRNCHCNATCPYCLNGTSTFKGVYAIALAEGGQLGFIDLKPGLIKQLSITAAKEGVSLGVFLNKRLLGVSREIKNHYTEYQINSTILTDADHDALMRSIYEGKNSDTMMKLMEKLETLVVPGSEREDGGFDNQN